MEAHAAVIYRDVKLMESRVMWFRALSGEVRGSAALTHDHWAALQEAWRPFAVACKTVWWECMALPKDAADEKNFREGKIPADISTSSRASWDMHCMIIVMIFQRVVP